jgi:ferredoxin-nitrite reductase
MKLNKIERLKAQESPYRYREKLFSLDLKQLDEETRFYLKNYGIYNIKLAPERFMLRIRVAGGRISLTDLETIASLAQREGLEILMTARAQLELHGLDAENILSVWERLRQEGITTLQTLTDNFRNIVSDPYDGRAVHNRVEVYPLIKRMEAYFLGKEAWMGMLPRKFNTAICGTEESPYHFFGNDLYFALAQREGVWGFNLYLGGKNSEAAQPAGIFVLPEEVPEMFFAVAQAYNRYGLRQTRSRTRLYHLLEEEGMEAFVRQVNSFYPKPLSSAGVLRQKKGELELFTPLDGGEYGCVIQSRFGKITPERVLEAVAFAQKRFCEIRVGVDQNLHLLGLESEEMPFTPVIGASHVTACAGSSYCALSLWNVKEETAYLPLQKIAAHQIQVGFSGCLKGCGRHHHCDIGLVGLRTNLFGQTQKAARVFLGGQYSSGGTPARLIFPSVPLSHLSSLIAVIIESYEQSGEEDFEQFSDRWLNPHSTFFVMLWFLSQLYLKQPPKLTQESEAKLYGKLAACADFPLFEDDEEYLQSIKMMMHVLWDDEVNEK